MTYYILFENNTFKGNPIGIIKCRNIREQFYKNHNLGSWDNGKYEIPFVRARDFIDIERGMWQKYKNQTPKSIKNLITILHMQGEL